MSSTSTRFGFSRSTSSTDVAQRHQAGRPVAQRGHVAGVQEPLGHRQRGELVAREREPVGRREEVVEHDREAERAVDEDAVQVELELLGVLQHHLLAEVRVEAGTQLGQGSAARRARVTAPRPRASTSALGMSRSTSPNTRCSGSRYTVCASATPLSTRLRTPMPASTSSARSSMRSARNACAHQPWSSSSTSACCSIRHRQRPGAHRCAEEPDETVPLAIGRAATRTPGRSAASQAAPAESGARRPRPPPRRRSRAAGRATRGVGGRRACGAWRATGRTETSTNMYGSTCDRCRARIPKLAMVPNANTNMRM